MTGAAPSKLKLDCRQGWEVNNFRVDGWRRQVVLNPVEFTETATKLAAEAYPPKQLVILDYEQWNLPDEIDKHIQVVDWWREVRPELRIGFYGIVPQLGYWPSISGGKQKQDWQRFNASLGASRNKQGQFVPRGLIDVIDFVCPCLYSFYPNSGGWDHEVLWHSHYAPATIEASRNYQKPVYPFVWQRIHDEAGKFDQLLSDEHFESQIRYCLDHADGVCIWDWADDKTGTEVLAKTNEVLKRFV